MVEPTRVLDHGTLELLDMMPADGNFVAAVAQAARVSYAEGTKTFREDLALVQYLLYHRHWSPFDQVKLKFRVRAPLFVRAQWYRHWSWDYNEESARYSEVREEYYFPEVWRGQAARNKQGSEGEVALGDGGRAQFSMALGIEVYRDMLNTGVAREQARITLPQAMYTTFIGTVGLRDLLVFLRQRLDPHAQWEIRQYASGILEVLRGLDPVLTSTVTNYFIDSVELTRDQWALVRKALAIGPWPLPAGWQGYGGLSKNEREGLDELFG